MQSTLRIENRNDCCFVDIEGVIGTPEEWQFDDPSSRVATYDKFRKNLELLREIESPEVVVNIRSTGGDVNDALLIYEALASLPGRIVTRCYGYTASAATVIAQAASPGGREMSAHALYLIHNSICATEGNAGELAARIDLLRRTDERLAALYASRSGRPAEEFAVLMGENNGQGRWLSAEEALAAGLVDRIVDTAAEQSDASSGPVARWRRLLGRIASGRPADGLPDDRNILHFDDPEPGAQLSALRFDEGQRRAQPTATLPCEDPSAGERSRTPNERAYAADARRMTR
ncbi:MAG: Clp protease ClpP [Alistipes sp.]|nr:Clp protease ClpP [Alistipes sp.]MDE7070077.1 Clp protease ClpP [Alistipes sp.]